MTQGRVKVARGVLINEILARKSYAFQEEDRVAYEKRGRE